MKRKERKFGPAHQEQIKLNSSSGKIKNFLLPLGIILPMLVISFVFMNISTENQKMIENNQITGATTINESNIQNESLDNITNLSTKDKQNSFLEKEKQKQLQEGAALAGQASGILTSAIQNYSFQMIFGFSLVIILLFTTILIRKKVSGRIPLRLEELEGLNKLEDWIEEMYRSGLVEFDIRKIIKQKSYWEKKHIDLLFHRRKIIEEMKKVYNLSYEHVKQLRMFIINDLRRGINKIETIKKLINKGWSNKELIILYVDTFHSIDKKKIERLRKGKKEVRR